MMNYGISYIYLSLENKIQCQLKYISMKVSIQKKVRRKDFLIILLLYNMLAPWQQNPAINKHQNIISTCTEYGQNPKANKTLMMALFFTSSSLLLFTSYIFYWFLSSMTANYYIPYLFINIKNR